MSAEEKYVENTVERLESCQFNEQLDKQKRLSDVQINVAKRVLRNLKHEYQIKKNSPYLTDNGFTFKQFLIHKQNSCASYLDDYNANLATLVMKYLGLNIKVAE